jgi:hypothetical protein
MYRVVNRSDTQVTTAMRTLPLGYWVGNAAAGLIRRAL